MSSDMAYEIYPDASGPLVTHVSIQAQRPEVPFEFSLEQGRRLAAASVAGALGTH